MTEDDTPARPPVALSPSAADEDHIFTIRMWLERDGLSSAGDNWRGRVRHRGIVTHFVGLATLFEVISKTLDHIARTQSDEGAR
jgi:hypothetical protein